MNLLLKELLSDGTGQLSSKRVSGILGFMLSGVVLLYCTYNVIEAPKMIDVFMLCCMGLLGVDSVTGIWKGK